MKVAVLSDLHAFSEETGGVPPSYLKVSRAETEPRRHPFVSLHTLIAEKKLSADVLICCGDIGDRADPASIVWAWSWLKRTRAALDYPAVFAASGNHDLDSRYAYSDYDAKGILQSLDPPYPMWDEDASDRYWARNFAVRRLGGCRFVVLNSAAYHGVTKVAKKDESVHGRVSNNTLARLRTQLSQVVVEDPAANVLVCHHHPFRIGDIDLTDYSEMEGGDALLALLGSGDFGRWLVIHGHRHWPDLFYGPGGGVSPVVFSAGSFSAVLYPEIATKARNQFYLLDLPLDEFDDLNLGLVGEFQAWDWIDNVGWLPAGDRSGLPHRGGFGYRGGGDLMSRQVAQVFEASGTDHLPWESLYAALPGLKYLVPSDIEVCIRHLRLHQGLHVLKENGSPVEIGRVV